MSIFYVNGEFVEEGQAQISVSDLSVLRGFGVFDYLRTYNGFPFHLDEHLQRLNNSARLIGLHLPQSIAVIQKIILETLSRNDHGESGIRIVVTGGLSSDGITPGETSNLMVMVTPAHKMPSAWYSEGAKVITSHIDRFMPGAKSINYIPAILCLNEARAQQAVESIYVDRDGFLQEGTTSNIFAIKGNTLITPPTERILPGITRQVTLELAKTKMMIVERPLHKDELRLIDEFFITSSVKEIMPIVAIDSVQLSGGKPGAITKKIMQMFEETTSSYSG